MEGLECPYCGEGLEVCHDDGFGYEENIKHEMQCDNCDKSFVFQTSIMYHYEPEKAECLNDGGHEYVLTNTFPKEFSKMECSMCGDIRELTNKEMVKFNIGSREEYFKSIK